MDTKTSVTEIKKPWHSSQRESIQVVRPAMMYGAETWAVKKAQEKKLDVAEMRMLRWMIGGHQAGQNEIIRGTTRWEKYPRKCRKVG